MNTVVITDADGNQDIKSFPDYPEPDIFSLHDLSAFAKTVLSTEDRIAWARVLKQPVIISSHGVRASHTGSTSEVILATIPCPGLLANDQLVIESQWGGITNNSNIKTPRIRFNGSSVHAPTLTTVASFQDRARISNRNNVASKVINANSATVFGATTAGVITASIDTSEEFEITLTAELANAGDTMRLESYLITLFPGD